MSAADQPWVCATASAMGSAHQRTGAPNQDAIASFETDHGVALAVADGHGGPRYVRSAIGSGFAVDVARKLGAELLRNGTDLAAGTAALPERIMRDWRQRVDEHLAANPFSPEEADIVGPDPVVAYGATLILVICRGDEAAAVQLGDGDVAVAWSDGSVSAPVPPEPRNVAGQTTSLCLPDAITSFRSASLRRLEQPPIAILAATDGYANSFAGADWDHAVMSDLHRQVAASGVGPIFDALPKWVAESANVGGDDTSVGIIFRGDAATAAAAAGAQAAAPSLPPPAAAASAPATAADGGSSGSSPRSRLPLILAPVLLLGGLGIGYLLGRGGEPDAVATTTVPVVESTFETVPTTVPTSEQPRPTLTPITVPPTDPATTPPTEPPATTTTVVTTLPPPPPVEGGGVVVVAAGAYRVVVDAFADTPTPSSVTNSGGASPIRQLLTTSGRWEIGADRSLTFTPEGGALEVKWPAEPGRTVEGLAFSWGRVVAVRIIEGESPLVDVAVFDGNTGGVIATGGPVGLDGTDSAEAIDASEQESQAEPAQAGEGTVP